MKPITYYYDSPAIQRLCEEYGACLEGMTREQKFEFIQSVAEVGLSVNRGEISRFAIALFGIKTVHDCAALIQGISQSIQ